jgi:hypothetical protein
MRRPVLPQSLFERLRWSLILAWASKRDTHGVRLYVFLPANSDERRTQFAKSQAAVELIRTHDPQAFRWLQHRSRGVLLTASPGVLGSWLSGPQLIRLADSLVVDLSETPAHIASVMVHELTHARLARAGVRYAPELRRRIEAICFRRQAAFAARLPGQERLAEHYQGRAREVLEESDARWTDQAMHDRRFEAFDLTGVPLWIAKPFKAWFQRRSA